MKKGSKKFKKDKDYEMIEKLKSFMDFATRLKIAQEDNKKNKKKKPNK